VDPRRKNPGAVDGRNLGLHTLDGAHTLLTTPHEHDALHDVIGILVLPGDSESRQIADPYRRDIADRDGDAANRGHHGLADVIHGMNETDTAYDGRLWPDVDRLAAYIDVAAVEGLQDLAERKAVLQQAVLIDADFVGLGLAAPAGDVNDSRHRFEAPLQHPVLERLQVQRGISLGTCHAVTIDLA